MNDFLYKESPLKKIDATNDQNDLSDQYLIFSQLKTVKDINDIYNLLSILSDTLTNRLKTLNDNFYSQWFIDLIKNNLSPQNPVLAEICVIILTKLFIIFKFINLECFLDDCFIDKYFQLLNVFNFKYHFVNETNDDSVISLRINVMRLILLISTNDNSINYCIKHINLIIDLLNKTQNDTLILLYSSFILCALKYENQNEIENAQQIELKIQTIVTLINLENIKNKLIGIEIFNQYLILFKETQDIHGFIPLIIPTFIDLLDDDSSEIVFSSLKTFETLYSIKVGLDTSQFHSTICDKCSKLILHHVSAVKHAAVKCILAFVLNHEEMFNSTNDYFFNLLSVGQEKGTAIQTDVSYTLANIVLKFDTNCLSQLPIQDILSLCAHILESDNYDLFDIIFRAIYILIDAVQTFNINSQVLSPIIELDIQHLEEKFPEQVSNIKEKMAKIINLPVNNI